MKRYRPVYAPEFRRRMVELVRLGRTPEELSREFGPTARSICRWVRQAEGHAGKPADGPSSAEKEELARSIWRWLKQAERDAGKPVDVPSSAEKKELARLRRENNRLRQERDILAKAAVWFARESKVTPNGSSGS